MVDEKTSRIALVLAAFLSGLLLFFALIVIISGRAGSPFGAPVSAVGGPFRLEDQNGKPVSDKDMKGRPYLVFFGFTHCPDVCPTTLLKLARARAAAHASWRVVFVSLDPGRDSPALLAQYLHAFDSSFVGLTGSAAAIGELAARFGVAFARVDLPGGDYTIDHSATLFLLDREGRMVAVFTPPFDEARLAADLDAAARS